jgi:hypothetical protein
MINFIKNILLFIRETFFIRPRDVPSLDKDYEQQVKILIDLINHERQINGLMPLDEIHELNIVALESARFNYQYYEFTTKPKGLTLQFRLMKLEYPVFNSGEIIVSLCENAQEAFGKMKIQLNSREVMKSGYFCHIGVGKCGNLWTAIFAQPRY